MVAAILTMLPMVVHPRTMEAGSLSVKREAPVRLVTDMAGRRVRLPQQVRHIVTLGPVPVLNGFIFAFGDGDKIVNGLPAMFNSPRYKYQTRFAPSLANKPALQGSGRGPNLEELLKVSPDVVFTMDRETVDVLESNGIATVFLSWRQPDDVKRLVRLVGEVLNKPATAEEYIQYFDGTVKRITGVVNAIPREKRVRVLYCNVKRLTQDHLIAEWWIETAGGISVTNNGRSAEAYAFSLEQMFAWNPDVLVVPAADDLEEVYRDRRFRDLKAVKAHRVFIAPTAAHLWANRTIEQPLTLLWAAKTFYPSEFRTLDMVKEMQLFYGHLFHYRMSEGEAREILSGN